MAYTEFFCQSGASNLNAGSTTTASVYTGTGNWVQATGVFTPSDNSTPASTVSVGMWGSIYITAGATVSLWVARITVVGAGVNGAVTVNTAGLGAKPANGSGTITLVVGGPWLGPNAAVGFPYTLSGIGNQQDTTAHTMRVNMKNDQTYTLTASFAFATSNALGMVVQGYTSSVNDGGKATWDGTTNTGAIISTLGSSGVYMIDHIFTTSITTGSTDLVITGANGNYAFIRCVFTGSRRRGLSVTGAMTKVIECEAYANNASNTASTGAFHTTAETFFSRDIAHDNAGSNTSGFLITGNGIAIDHCVSETNGGNGISQIGSAGTAPVVITNSDLYNNTGDGVNIVTASTNLCWIENNNFFKNAKGINNVSVLNSGFAYNNTYGVGTQANTGADVTNNLTVTAAVNYPSNLLPWVDAANGNFSQQPNQGIIGRGAFTETAASYTGTVGYPFTGAAPAQIVPELRIPSIASI